MPSNYKDLRDLFDGWLKQSLDSLYLNNILSDSISYMLSAPAKRIRPVLTLMIGEMLGVEKEDLRPYCLAIEYLHNSTLIHDDLPALDNDDFRRGLETCHKKFGEANAILAADLMIGSAFSQIALAETVVAEVRVIWSDLLSSAYMNICNGQALDIKHAKVATSVEQLEVIDLQKTAALFVSAIIGPTALIEQEQREVIIPKLSEFACNLGLLFQITDDIIDYNEQDKEAEDSELNYVKLLGREAAHKRSTEIYDKSLDILNELSYDSSQIKMLLERVLTRKE
ncbi:MAG: polyprenyl synthetase family protein [Proteobacteria bacterium]|nr:polyprenyl synthetase family protein [Pseudomonadota bacterium]